MESAKPKSYDDITVIAVKRYDMEQPFPNELKHLYKEAEFIGSGGFARVFRAKHRDGRIVAVKIPINFDEAIGKSCGIVFDIVEGLKYAHKQGINNCFGGIVYYYLWRILWRMFSSE